MRKFKLLLSLSLFLSILFYNTQLPSDTFSICAVDPVTGQVGSAGASCIAGSLILSDVHPGRGVIHTQSYWHPQNQQYARYLMQQGYSPQQIIDSLVAHDAQKSPTIRQYGIVDLIGGGRSAAYTGINCFDWKGHLLTPTFAIAGNILLGPQILDSMRSRFLNTPGTLADKLMAALQGAKVIGADTRCLSRGTSSISAFIRVGRPQDTTGTLYLDLNVNYTDPGHDPIDSLQVLYNMWLTGISTISSEIPEKPFLYQNYPNPFNPITKIKFDIPLNIENENVKIKLVIYDILGRETAVLVNQELKPGTYETEWDASEYQSGVYFYRLAAGEYTETRKMSLVK
ncbi:MAG: DUF1028 domain-containing protein [Ignavibacteria bacterium]